MINPQAKLLARLEPQLVEQARQYLDFHALFWETRKGAAQALADLLDRRPDLRISDEQEAELGLLLARAG